MPGPFSAFDSLSNLYGSGLRGAGRPPEIPSLPPAEEESWLSKLGSGALHGLAWVGSSLDKAFGGRALRGLIGGKPEELLSIIPFSDTLGITSPENVVTGSELLGNKEADFLSPEGIGGLLTEMALDPATYLSFGSNALNKLGQSAKKAGVLPETAAGRLAGVTGGAAEDLARTHFGLQDLMGPIAPQKVQEVAGQRLGGHMGIGLPFSGDQAVYDLSGLGNVIQKTPVIGSIADAARNAINYLDEKVTGPLFRKSYGNQNQQELQSLFQREIHNKQPIAGMEARRTARMLAEEANALNLLTPEGGKQIRDWMENVRPVPAEYEPFVNRVREALGENLSARQAAGLHHAAPLFEQTILSGPGQGNLLGYAPRHLTETGERRPDWIRTKVFSPADERARKEMFSGLPTSRLNELAREDMTQLQRHQVEDTIATQYLGLSPTYKQDLQQARDVYKQLEPAYAQVRKKLIGPNDPGYQTAKQMADQAEKLAGDIRNLEVRSVQAQNLAKWKQGVGKAEQDVFGNHPLEDILVKLLKDNDRILKANAMHAAIAEFAAPLQHLEGATVPLPMFLERNNLAPGGEALQQTVDAIASKYPNDPIGINSLHLPAKFAEPLSKFLEVTHAPDGIKPVLSLFDSMTNLTKAFQTAPWPAHQIRNQMSAAFQHWIHGISEGGNYIKPWQDAQSLLHTGVIQDAANIPGLQHLGPIEASQQLARELIDWDVLHRRGRAAAEFTTDEAKLGQSRIMDLLPGQPKPGIFESYVQGMKTGSWNPLEVGGAFGHQTDQFKFIKAGRQLQSTLDDINRASVYIAKRREGFSPLEALKAVNEVHYDYGNLSQFERGVMRRIVPFYGWMRQNIPAVLYELATEPGGRTGAAVRASARARGEAPGFLPDYIGSGLALPIGAEEDGTKRFLSRLGLPFEDLGELVTGAGPVGSLNPLLKGPLEIATGKQFYTGRDIRDLYSMSGAVLGQRMDTPENLLINSPVGRLMTTFRTLGDERKDAAAKAMNLLTGLRLTDVDMNKAKGIATRNLIEQQLHGQPGVNTFENLYVKPENMPLLSPAEQALYRLYLTQQRRANSLARS